MYFSYVLIDLQIVTHWYFSNMKLYLSKTCWRKLELLLYQPNRSSLPWKTFILANANISSLTEPQISVHHSAMSARNVRKTFPPKKKNPARTKLWCKNFRQKWIARKTFAPTHPLATALHTKTNTQFRQHCKHHSFSLEWFFMQKCKQFLHFSRSSRCWKMAFSAFTSVSNQQNQTGRSLE